MNRRGAGVVFCCIAAFLFSTKYISTAIFASNLSSWSTELFSEMLKYTGGTLTVLSLIALAAGVTYLFLAEKEK